MKTLSREGIQRMIEGSGAGSGSGGAGGSSGGGSVENARHADSAYDVDINSPAYLRWLRKDVADTAAEVITFAKGIISTLKSYFNGGIEVTNGTKTDVLNVTGGANVGGSLGVTGNATIGGNASVTGSVTAAQLIANLLKTPDFQQIVGMIGLGFGVTTDVNGKATLQTDDLYVLGQMFVNSLNIREVTYIGGTYLLTPAGSTVAKVMPLYAASGYSSYNTRYWTTTPPYASATVVGYRLMWKADDGTTGTMNYWQQGDQAFCQTFNITAPGQYTNARNSRYWRMVCRVGQVTVDNVVWHYADVANTASVYLYDSNGNAITNVRTGNTIFPGYENSSGTVPSVDDKVVCLGSQAQTNRQGAIQLTAEGSASIGIYDNINNFLALTNYEIHYFSKEAVRMTASYLTWKTSSGNETQATFMADTKQAFVGIGNCGIDFAHEVIRLKGNKVIFSNTAGDVSGKIWIDPTKGALHAVDGYFSGNIYTPYFELTSSNIGDYATRKYDSTYQIYYYDLNLPLTGLNLQIVGTNPTSNPLYINLPQTADYLGAEANIVCTQYYVVVRNAYGMNSATDTTMTMTSFRPMIYAGQKMKLKCIYYDSSYIWVIDSIADYKANQQPMIAAMGKSYLAYTNNAWVCNAGDMWTYNGATVTISRTGEGKYRVTFSGLNITLSDPACFISVYGIGYVWDGTTHTSNCPCKATLLDKGSNYFDVCTSDDAEIDDGVFGFTVYYTGRADRFII